MVFSIVNLVVCLVVIVVSAIQPKKTHLSPSPPSKPLSMSGSRVFCKKYVQVATVLSKESGSTRLQVQSYCLVVLNKYRQV